MKDFAGSVAVITGAASGIGLGLAGEAVRRGMKVVVSDIRPDALEAAAKALAQAGGEVLAKTADVTRAADLEALAAAAVARFGKVNLLVNNAGAFVGGLAWETPAEQYDWIVALNLKSVLYGIRAFVPRMIAQGDPCHVVTIASAAGITVYPGYAAYSSTKHAALAATEALYLDLAAESIGNVGVTVVMPGMVRTKIMEPEKASPEGLDLARRARFENRTVRSIERVMTGALERAMPPEELATRVFDAVADGRLYVLPNHDSEANQAVAKAVGVGRATGVDPFAPILDTMLRSMERADEAGGGAPS
jgi:NAD(P)-dependent dehydrogenase (short-subunit alcohol dehydrogenase family)